MLIRSLLLVGTLVVAYVLMMDSGWSLNSFADRVWWAAAIPAAYVLALLFNWE